MVAARAVSQGAAPLRIILGTPTIVGDPPQMTDGDDATYAALTTSRDTPSGPAHVDIVEYTVPPTTVSALSFGVRVKGHVDVADYSAPELGPSRLSWNVFGSQDRIAADVHPLPTEPGPFEFTRMFTPGDYDVWDFGDYDSSPGLLRSNLADGTVFLRLFADTLFTGTALVQVTIYEWQLLAEFARTLPPARLFPRDDGLGMSAGTRVWPPPKSQQGSSRVGPGSYW